MQQKIETLKPYEFNREFFEDVKGTDYEGLKEDIRLNGIKVDLHITKSNTILCGHQRWNIAKELGLSHVPVKIVDIDESDDNKVKEYVIKDNLLRRQLTIDQKWNLYAILSKVYEFPTGSDRKSKEYLDAKVASGFDNVLIKTAKETGVSERTIARAREWKTIVDISPELKTQSPLKVINDYEVKQGKVIKRINFEEINLEKINPYDNNMFYFSHIFYEKRFGDTVICIDPSHKNEDGTTDIREYKDYYPTVTKHSRFFDNKGKEFSLRKYAEIQNFPEWFKFVGTSQEIKNQIGEAVSPYMASYIIHEYIKGKTYIELFCGCGGFSYGAHQEGKKCLWSNDFNIYAGYSFKLNFPKVNVVIGDIKEIDEKEVHKEIGDIDFIIGGPPCQGFSVAGKRLGFKEDSRNQLYLEFLRFVKEFKPKQFIMENVPQILENKEEIIEDFEKIGYNVETDLVNGKDINMEQQRKRVFFIGNLRKTDNKQGDITNETN
jgi:site-specific DNA-cytosine methylase